MEDIILSIKRSCIEIAELMKNANPFSLSEILNNNQSGDEVKKLDLISNDILKNKLKDLKNVRIIGSEEEDNLFYTENKEGRFMVCYDPLDGSSNIDINVTVGTIFAIYDLDKKLVDGNNIVCAGYCLYGSSTQFVIAQENIKMYMLKNNNFELIKSDLQIKEKGNIYSFNESNKYKWFGNHDNMLIMHLLDNNYSSRWIGSMVTDCHRTLIKGGIFAYPSNAKDINGKIRLLYEAYPFAFIFKIAGGKSSNGNISILDIPFPENIHQKTAVYLGSKYEINLLDSLVRNN